MTNAQIGTISWCSTQPEHEEKEEFMTNICTIKGFNRLLLSNNIVNFCFLETVLAVLLPMK